MLGSLQIDRLYLCEKYYGQKSTPGKFKFKKWSNYVLKLFVLENFYILEQSVTFDLFSEKP